MPGRRAGQQRVEVRVKSNKSTQETGGSQQPSKGCAQGRGHRKHTASTTLQQSTGEGGTRGTDERQHHASRHAPQRNHTHRTHPRPRQQHVASGPRLPAQRAGSRGRGGAGTQTPPTTPVARSPPRACQPQGWWRAPTLALPRPQHVGGRSRQPARRAGSQRRGSA